ncbi:MAG TPA: FMN-binding negative transcriptional regulator [Caulobacteraceae bacterium]|nr:FMN-binding negative transcriptional regulator [Caulobacteraceae bacterium]
MYPPAAFVVDDPAVIEAMVGRVRLGMLVTHGPGGLAVTHLPFLYDAANRRLLGHMARSNPQRAGAGDGEALAILPGPEAYVSPDWYPSKADDGRQVPTWNYETVHLHGTLEWFEDRGRLLDAVARLSERHEAGRPRPWSIADAPADYVERLLRGIVGVEMRVTRIEARRKLGQNKPERDRAGVIEGLAMSPDPRDRLMAELMQSED